MKTLEFIYNNVGVERIGSKVFSSVMVDNKGVIYSYGYHYPLATIINGIGFVNTKGYSTTTAKHISWAKSALAQKVGWNNVYAVELVDGYFNAETIKRSALRQLKQLDDEMSTKARTNTKLYGNLRRSWDRTMAALAQVYTIDRSI